jgi:hypothetical protein
LICNHQPTFPRKKKHTAVGLVVGGVCFLFLKTKKHVGVNKLQRWEQAAREASS